MERMCQDCGQGFVIEAAELELFSRLAAEHPETPWKLPKRCTACRAERRRAHETVSPDGGAVTLRCTVCAEDFQFGTWDRQFYAERGYRYPRRCPACRTGGGRRPG
jgi:Probable zinc-ribbon domain